MNYFFVLFFGVDSHGRHPLSLGWKRAATVLRIERKESLEQHEGEKMMSNLHFEMSYCFKRIFVRCTHVKGLYLCSPVNQVWFYMTFPINTIILKGTHCISDDWCLMFLFIVLMIHNNYTELLIYCFPTKWINRLADLYDIIIYGCSIVSIEWYWVSYILMYCIGLNELSCSQRWWMLWVWLCLDGLTRLVLSDEIQAHMKHVCNTLLLLPVRMS